MEETLGSPSLIRMMGGHGQNMHTVNEMVRGGTGCPPIDRKLSELPTSKAVGLALWSKQMGSLRLSVWLAKLEPGLLDFAQLTVLYIYT